MMNGTVGIKKGGIVDKDKQKQLIIEIMRGDEEFSLYDLSREDIEKIIKTCQDSPEPNSALRNAAKDKLNG